MPTEIQSTLHFRTLLGGYSYLVVDFHAKWCPPCKTIAPLYSQLSTTHSVPGKLEFVKVDTDEQQELAAQYGIQSLPTFLVFKEGKKIEEIKGAHPPALKNIVERIGGEAKAEAQKAKVEEKPMVGKTGDATVEEGIEQKTVSGGYGMSGGSDWKLSLNR